VGTATAARTRDPRRLLGHLLAGTAVALALGGSGLVHDPAGDALVGLFGSASIPLT
jgi:hypothetical protein